MTERIGDQLKADDEVRRQQERVQHDNQIELLGLVVGGIAHDLRNFLHVVGGLVLAARAVHGR